MEHGPNRLMRRTVHDGFYRDAILRNGKLIR
jgi:hypothetical protein